MSTSVHFINRPKVARSCCSVRSWG